MLTPLGRAGGGLPARAFSPGHASLSPAEPSRNKAALAGAGAAPFNILMYSHDSYGLGHIRRTMAIAAELLDEGVNALILTGSPLAGRFPCPAGVDFVRAPGMIKLGADQYAPSSFRLDAAGALAVRRAVFTAAAEAFRPDLVIVDKTPLGLKKEILPMLERVRRDLPRTRIVLGLRDILDDPGTAMAEWRQKGVMEVLEACYSEIWVYGNRNLYDPVSEYAIPEAISRKMIFTGYIPRRIVPAGEERPVRASAVRERRKKTLAVTAGGGGDGYPLLDAVMRMLEMDPDPPFRTVFVSGPFMPKAERQDLARRARLVSASFHHFFRRLESLLEAADAVVSMGGYNTVCEILTLGKPCLIIPRETPRLEQRIRAEVLHRQGLVDFMPWNEVEPRRLRDRILNLLDNPSPYQEAIRSFDMTGIAVMRERLGAFRAEKRERRA